MKIKKAITKSSRKKVVVLSTAVLLLLGAAVGAFYMYSSNATLFGWTPFPKQNSGINYGPATADEINTGNDIKEGTVGNPSTKPNQETGDKPSDDPSQPAVGPTISITSAQQNGSVVQIRVLIEKLTNSGSCSLELKAASGKVVSQSSGVQALSSYSTCQGFDVQTSSLETGTWTAVVTYIDGSNRSTSTVNIEVVR